MKTAGGFYSDIDNSQFLLLNMDTGLLFEHFNDYVNDSDNDMNTPEGAVRLLREDSNFSDFVDNITEGIDDNSRGAVGDILQRQRETLLTESANVGASVFTHGWTVLSFPILVDIYANNKIGLAQ